jgi:TRAP transporter TAXI family solute receptor
MKINRRFALTVIILLSFVPAFPQMVILSGPEKGTYNRFAADIVKVLGEKNGIKLLSRTTAGSGFNFKELTDPSAASKIAIIQSDYLSFMQAQDRLNSTNKTGSIKVLMPLATEEMHLVVKKSSGIKGLQDLSNKKVAIGSEAQGSFVTGKIMNERSKVNWIPTYDAYDMLIRHLSEGNIDAFLLVGSAPVKMLDIDPQVMVDEPALLELDDFNGWAQYYENDTIFRGDYRWLDKDIPTFSVRALLVVNEAKLKGDDIKAVESIKSAIIQDLEILKKEGHPKWAEVVPPAGSVTVKPKSTTVSKSKSPAAATGKSGVIYRVQIFSESEKQNMEDLIIKGKSYKTWVYAYSGAYRYTIGEFTSLSPATELQELCRKSGYPQAFIAAFKNNVRSNDPKLFK